MREDAIGTMRGHLSFPKLTAIAIMLLLSILTLAASGQGQPSEVQGIEELYLQANTAQQNGDNATAIEKYKAIIQLDPTLAEAYNNLGRLYFNVRSYSDAVSVLQHGLAIDSGMYPAYVILGTAYSQMGEYKKATVSLEKAEQLKPNDAHVQRLLASALVNFGDFEGAATRLRSVLANDPNDQEALYLLGKTYLQLSKDMLARITQGAPDSVLALEIRGEQYENIDDFNGALIEYKKAVKLDPLQPGTHFHLANTFWIMGQWASAQKEFEAELENDPSSCVSMWKRADSILENNGPPDDALQGLNRALSQCPQLVQAHLDRARILVTLRQYNSAFQDLQIVETANPDESSVHFLLSKVFRVEGKSSEADAEMKTFARLLQKEGDKSEKHAKDVIAIGSETR